MPCVLTQVPGLSHQSCLDLGVDHSDLRVDRVKTTVYCVWEVTLKGRVGGTFCRHENQGSQSGSSGLVS